MSSQIGFEAVMRIRCTRGMSLHTFHGEYRKGSSSSKQIQKREYCFPFSTNLSIKKHSMVKNLSWFEHCRSFLCEIDRLVELTKCQPRFSLWHAGIST